MNSTLLSLMSNHGIKQETNGIYLAEINSKNKTQAQECELREKVASVTYDNYFDTISNNHYISVKNYK